ncbi:hypothetical protein OHC33_010584 [Knufia fluminis]|uniref:NAD(P)-binding domain-containing protein n=1 Tax=Knufia fluminis TaxID=191047 RepID=A0AAN8I3G0_9EURO|nr:hypothetical protein OHC33_010584 [Knufia fluminis]
MTGQYAKDQPSSSSNRIEKVAIVGAGGSIGKHIASHLLKTGKHTITALARPDSTGQLPDGLHIIKIDYTSDDDTALVTALRGQQALIITMSVSAPPNTTLNLIRAAAKANVPYILPNWYGHDPANNSLCNDTFLSDRRDSITSEIARLGVSAYILLACNFWYEFSLGGGPDRYGFDFKNRSLILFDAGNVPINTSTWPQCGRAIANLLSLKEVPEDENDTSPTLSQFRNGSVYISSFRVSQRDMFESVKRVTGTRDADWSVTCESAEQRRRDGRDAVQGGDMRGFIKLMYSRMFFGNGDGDYESARGLHNKLLGLPVEDLDEFTAVAVRLGEEGEVVSYGHGAADNITSR